MDLPRHASFNYCFQANVFKIPWTDASSIKATWKRARFTVNRADYDDLIKRLSDDNDALIRLTSTNLDLEPVRSRKKQLGNLAAVKSFAKSLFEVLQKGHKCGCSHQANLQLTRVFDDSKMQPLRFRIVLVHEGHLAQGPIWEDIEVRMLESIRSEPGKFLSLRRNPSSTPLIATVVPVLGQTISIDFSSKQPHSKQQSKQNPCASVAAIAKTQEQLEIPDLCKTLQALNVEQRTSCLGWLKDDWDRKHEFYARTLKDAAWSAKSLRDAICQSMISREQRLELAVVLSWSVLQLYQTPWHSLCPEDIHFLLPDAYDEAFVSRDLSWRHEHSEPPSPFIRNETLTALGILLIELCLGRPIEDCGKQSSILEKFVLASRLLDQVYQEAGLRYESAVRRCLYCDFDHRKPDLNDAAFCEVFYAGVVQPLEEDLRNFRGEGLGLLSLI